MNHAERYNYPLGPALDFLRRLWRLNHALEILSSRMDQRIGVTAQQCLLIRCVGKYPGVTAGQLAGLLHIDPGTASATLKRLEEKRMVERRRDPRDKRRIALGLTARGRQVDRRTEGTVEQAAQRMLDEISPDDAVRVTATLERFTSLLEANEGRHPPSRKSRSSGGSRARDRNDSR